MNPQQHTQIEKLHAQIRTANTERDLSKIRDELVATMGIRKLSLKYAAACGGVITALARRWQELQEDQSPT